MAIKSKKRYAPETMVGYGLFIAPTISTLTMPEGFSAMQLGDNLFLNGFNVHYESVYLRDRNWLQISCMNDVTEKELDRMLQLLRMLAPKCLEQPTLGI